MLTYVKGEPLRFSFVTQDMNREQGADPVLVTLYRLGSAEPVARESLGDDGNVSDDQKSSPLRTVSIELVAPEEGAYRIEFTATADTFIREIRTAQSKIVFEGGIFLGDLTGYSDRVPAATVYVSGSRIAARTPHAEGMQTITVAGQGVPLDAPNDIVTAPLSKGVTEVVAPKRNVRIETDGLIALSRGAWFDPLPYAVGSATTRADLDARGIDFVLAAYAAPAAEGAVRQAEATFDLHSLARTPSGAFRFAFAALNPDPDAAGIQL